MRPIGAVATLYRRMRLQVPSTGAQDPTQRAGDEMILVTGASGLLGANLTIAARTRELDVVAAYGTHPVHFEGIEAIPVDLTSPKAIETTLEAVRPDWIIHCAAATDVDWCEAHPDEARRINAEVPRNLAKAARLRKAKFLHMSTDAVFDGRGGSYDETDAPAPVNVYGATKWEGERAVREILPTSLVVRTNLYGWNLLPKQSLAEWILDLLESGTPVPGFDDVVFTPILADDLAGLLLDMVNRSQEGLYHVAGSEALSKCEFARRLARVFGYNPGLVRPVPLADSHLQAPRPRNTTLRTDKAARALGRVLPTAEEGLRRFKLDRDSGYLARLRSCRGG